MILRCAKISHFVDLYEDFIGFVENHVLLGEKGWYLLGLKRIKPIFIISTRYHKKRPQ